MNEKRILLLHISKVSGHQAACAALNTALLRLNPHLSIKVVNAACHTNPMLEKVVNQAYMSIIRMAPDIWNYLYDNPNILAKSQYIRQLIHRYNSARFDELIFRYKPDCVVCTQAFPCTMAANFKKYQHRGFKLMGVLTDFAPHAYWIDKEVDYYIVPAQGVGDKFIEQGIAPDKIKSFGIPIDPKYDDSLPCFDIARKYGLKEGCPTILIMGGGQGLGPIVKLTHYLDRMRDLDFQVIVATGTNRFKYSRLLAYQKFRKKHFITMPYSSHIDELMQIADVIISKPGGLTMQEALTKRVPIIIMAPLPGQEILNTKYLLRRKVAVLARTPREVIVYLRDLFENPLKMERMRQNAAKHFEHKSATRTAEFIIQQI